MSLSSELVYVRGVLVWRRDRSEATAQSIADWFDVAYPEPWWVKAKRLREATEDIERWAVAHPGWNRHTPLRERQVS